ncbi:hypothetical protein C8Q80DRAFT_1121070 [Daedaleopsis nitida]|nr:hypothetical protein C8Q80DRAFT_1121070 [Daedaleopsis nitida]
MYKIPTGQKVDTEYLGRRWARYIQIASEDAEVLSQLDPTLRDHLIKRLYDSGEGAENAFPEQFVEFDDDPDPFLKAVDEKIDGLTPPKNSEERVLRAHLANAAMMVFQHYKIHYALMDLPRRYEDAVAKTMERQYVLTPSLWLSLAAMPPNQRYTLSMGEWYAEVLPTLRKAPSPYNPSNSPTEAGHLPTPGPPTPAATSSLQASADDHINLEHMINNPRTLFGKRFLCTPPADAESSLDVGGKWHVVSFRIEAVDGDVDTTYEVVLEEELGTPIPFGEDEVREYLKHSVLIPSGQT